MSATAQACSLSNGRPAGSFGHSAPTGPEATRAQNARIPAHSNPARIVARRTRNSMGSLLLPRLRLVRHYVIVDPRVLIHLMGSLPYLLPTASLTPSATPAVP